MLKITVSPTGDTVREKRSLLWFFSVVAVPHAHVENQVLSQTLKVPAIIHHRKFSPKHQVQSSATVVIYRLKMAN